MSAEKSELENQSGRRGLVANLVLVAAWVYVAMIYLLACDQQFHWGIFSPLSGGPAGRSPGRAGGPEAAGAAI